MVLGFQGEAMLQKLTLVLLAGFALLLAIGCSSESEQPATDGAQTRYVATDGADVARKIAAYVTAFADAFRNGTTPPVLEMKDGQKFSSGDVTNFGPGATEGQIASFNAMYPLDAANVVSRSDAHAFEAFLRVVSRAGSRSAGVRGGGLGFGRPPFVVAVSDFG